MDNAVERAIAKVGGLTKLAQAVGVDYQHVQHWRKRGAPPKYWRAIETATDGAVTVEDLLRQKEVA